MWEYSRKPSWEFSASEWVCSDAWETERIQISQYHAIHVEDTGNDINFEGRHLWAFGDEGWHKNIVQKANIKSFPLWCSTQAPPLVWMFWTFSYCQRVWPPEDFLSNRSRVNVWNLLQWPLSHKSSRGIYIENMNWIGLQLRHELGLGAEHRAKECRM